MKIEKIDTCQQAKTFAEQIKKESKTYFLQGAWGSGKTEYLLEVKGNIGEKYRFVDLALWKPKNKSSLSKILFRKIHPILGGLFSGLGYLFIISSIMGSVYLAISGLKNSGELESFGEQNLFLSLTTVAVILTTLYSFIQSKWVDLDKFYIWWAIKSLKRKRKPIVLIIDDFDRLDKELQKELYTLFNAIHEKTRVIFVGDLNKIEKVEDNYLGKIIDQRVALPFSLHSRNIVLKVQQVIKDKIKERDREENKLEKRFDFTVVKTLFVEENRTLRDANQFLNYVEKELDGQDKIWKVQIDQQLFVIYLYIFHPQEYQKLLDGWLPKDKSERTSEEIDIPNVTLVFRMMNEILQPRKSNPADFRKNSSVYFIDELANNHSIWDLRNIIMNETKELTKLFAENIQPHSTNFDEFFDYVKNMRPEEYTEVQLILEKNAILTLKSEIRYQPNELIKSVFEQRNREAIELYWGSRRNPNVDVEILIPFEEMFTKFETNTDINISLSEKMYYFHSCLNLVGTTHYDSENLMYRAIPIVNTERVMSHFLDSAKKIEMESNFGERDYDADAIIVQIGYHFWKRNENYSGEISDFETKSTSIEKLKDSEYIAFWNEYSIRPVKDTTGGIVLSSGSALEFDYEGKCYEDIVLNKLIEIGDAL